MPAKTLTALVTITIFLAACGLGASQSPKEDGQKAKPTPDYEANINLLQGRATALETQSNADRKAIEALNKRGEEVNRILTTLSKRADVAEKENDRLKQWKAGAESTLTPLGAMMPYFADDLPNSNFVWADGTTNWPDEPWVAPPYRGKPVPDMRGVLIGGVEDFRVLPRFEDQVYRAGSLTVAGSSFAVESQPEERSTHGFENYTIADGRSHGLALLGFNNSPLAGNDVWHRGILGNNMETQAYFPSIPGDNGGMRRPRIIARTPHKYYVPKIGKVAGQVTIPLRDRATMPPYVQCRWIIRVK